MGMNTNASTQGWFREQLQVVGRNRFIAPFGETEGIAPFSRLTAQ
jgi:hypothetical protein